MANKTRTRLYTRWRGTIAPGHTTNDRESYTVHKPTFRDLFEPDVRQHRRRVEAPRAETKPDLEELGKFLKGRGIRVTKLRGNKTDG